MKKILFLHRLSKTARRMHLPHWAFNYSSSFLMQLPKIKLDESLRIPYTVRAIDNSDLKLLAYCREMDNPEEGVRLFAERISAGAHCYALFDLDKKVLGYMWITLSSNLLEDQDRYQIHCSDSQAYIFDTYLHRGARGKNLYGFMIAQVQEILYKRKISDYFVIVDETNIISLKAHSKLGAFKLEKVVYWCFFGITGHSLKTKSQRKNTVALFGNTNLVHSLALPPKIE